MKVPKYIKYHMTEVVKHSELVTKHMEIVENWLERKGYDIESLRSGSGRSLEELEYGVNVVDDFCEAIENGEDV